jgi:hypothetical protein
MYPIRELAQKEDPKHASKPRQYHSKLDATSFWLCLPGAAFTANNN